MLGGFCPQKMFSVIHKNETVHHYVHEMQYTSLIAHIDHGDVYLTSAFTSARRIF